jgi:hypothetical protein
MVPSCGFRLVTTWRVLLDGVAIVAMTNLWRYDPVKTLRVSTQLVEGEREEALEIPKKRSQIKSQESYPGLDFENFFQGVGVAVAVSPWFHDNTAFLVFFF